MKTERSVFKSIVNFFIHTHAPTHLRSWSFHRMTTIECHIHTPRRRRTRSARTRSKSTGAVESVSSNFYEQCDLLHSMSNAHHFMQQLHFVILCVHCKCELLLRLRVCESQVFKMFNMPMISWSLF